MDLYSEKILEHFRSSPYKRILSKPSSRIVEFNPVCGDVVQLDLAVRGGKIVDAGFMGTGCAISQAGTSLLIERLIGKSLQQAKKITPRAVKNFLSVPISPAREKCAFLGLTALRKAVTILENTTKERTKKNAKIKRK